MVVENGLLSTYVDISLKKGEKQYSFQNKMAIYHINNG